MKAKAVTQIHWSRIQMESALEFQKRRRDSCEVWEESCPKLAARTDLVLTLENEGKRNHSRKDSEP